MTTPFTFTDFQYRCLGRVDDPDSPSQVTVPCAEVTRALAERGLVMVSKEELADMKREVEFQKEEVRIRDASLATQTEGWQRAEHQVEQLTHSRGELEAALKLARHVAAGSADNTKRLMSERDEARAELARVKAEAEKYRLGMQENCQLRSELEKVKAETAALDAHASTLEARDEQSERIKRHLRSQLEAQSAVVEAAVMVASTPSEINLRLLSLAVGIQRASAGSEPKRAGGESLSERYPVGTPVEAIDFGPRHNQQGHVIDTDLDSILVRFPDGKDEAFSSSELYIIGNGGPVETKEPRAETGPPAPSPCSGCDGKGITDDRGFALRGQPYFATISCRRCLGDEREPASAKAEEAGMETVASLIEIDRAGQADAADLDALRARIEAALRAQTGEGAARGKVEP
jgi:hypothetical protein